MLLPLYALTKLVTERDTGGKLVAGNLIENVAEKRATALCLKGD